MGMKQCPVCGEEYSDTYKKCPFCEEEAAMKAGESIHRGGRRTAQRSRQFSLITPTLVVLILIMAGLLVYLLYGDKIADHFGGEEPAPPAMEDPALPVVPEEDEEQEEEEPSSGEEEPVAPEEEEVVMPEESGPAQHEQVKPPVQPQKPNKPSGGYENALALPDGLTLSTSDFTLSTLGEQHTIQASGGKGTYHWYSEDDGIAAVDNTGKVTAVSRGTVNVVVSDGFKKGTCIVRVTASGKLDTVPTGDAKPTNAKLSKEDYTTKVGDPEVKLTVSGSTGTVKWSSSDSAVASVSADGVVKAVGKGTATITANVGGSPLYCIVRVK